MGTFYVGTGSSLGTGTSFGGADEYIQGFTWAEFTGDDFTGANDDPLDPVVWTDTEDDVSFSIQSNKANLTGLASGEKAQSNSKFLLTGDFNIQIDVDSIVLNHADSFYTFLVADAETASTTAAYVRLRAADDVFAANFKVGGSWDSSVTVERTADYGKLKMVRTGNNVVCSSLDGDGDWVVIANGDIGTADMYVILNSQSGAGDTVSGNFDNFVINSGTVSGV